MTPPILLAKNLSLVSNSGAHILQNVSLHVQPQEILAVVGESGAGKTSLAKILTRILKPSSGQLLFQNRNIADLNDTQMLPLRPLIHLIHQDSLSSLNPRKRVRHALIDALLASPNPPNNPLHVAAELMRSVSLDPAFLSHYPHQLSGGQRQRIGVARAVALKPKLIVADEITASLDPSSRAVILSLILSLHRSLGAAVVFISHDLHAVRLLAQRICVLHNGQIVETQNTNNLFDNPRSPHTAKLIHTLPPHN